jgi:hypothetical protein
MSTEITVRGAFSAFRPAERGTVHTTVGYEGPEMELGPAGGGAA